MAEQQESGESRKAVRMVDRILFAYEEMEPARFKQIVDDFNSGIPPYNQAGLADIQMYIGAQNALFRIREKDKDLADFLQHLDTKINIMLKSARGEQTPFDRLALLEVNLSGSGMAFWSPQPVAANTILGLHLVLLPDHTYIYCFGKVVGCKDCQGKDPARPHAVSVKFILIMEDDREKLIQHNFRQQSLALRQRRQNQ